MKTNRFEFLKSIINLDYENRHDNPQMYFTWEDLKWLIEQAERAERMEMMYENTGSIMNRRHQINKIERYEKALKEIASREGDYYEDEVACIAKEALEN